MAPDHTVLRAHIEDGSSNESPAIQPARLSDVLAAIQREKPAVVFAPHVETSTGIILPDAYIQAVADAVHNHGGHFVLDGVAAGLHWIDMKACGVDFYLTAPQKGWSSPPAVGVVMMGEGGYAKVLATTSNSMVLNIRKWNDVMESYLDGKFSYYTTMPTDAIMLFRDMAKETRAFGLERSKREFSDLGGRVVALVQRFGFKPVAMEGFRSPGVVVVYTKDKDIVAKFRRQGLQVAAGVPFQLGEPAAIWEQGTTVRFGLFGLDKIYDIDGTVAHIESALSVIAPSGAQRSRLL